MQRANVEPWSVLVPERRQSEWQTQKGYYNLFRENFHVSVCFLKAMRQDLAKN